MNKSPGVVKTDNASDLYETSFENERTETSASAFAGESSDAQWMQILLNELNLESSGQQPAQFSSSSDARYTNMAEDRESLIIGSNGDPYQVPIEATADALVNTYFSTVHISFPILQPTLFMQQYYKSKSIWHRLLEFGDHAFLTILQLVLAIGAVHSRLSNTGIAMDNRDRLLYFARAKMLAFDVGSPNDEISLSQAQVFGLSAVYCLVTNQTNR